MATPAPGSTLEHWMLEGLRQRVSLLEFSDLLQRHVIAPLLGQHLTDQVVRFKIRRAPYTDDSWQMLDDLGIEPAKRRVRLPPTNEITITTKQIVWPQ